MTSARLGRTTRSVLLIVRGRAAVVRLRSLGSRFSVVAVIVFLISFSSAVLLKMLGVRLVV